MRLRAALVLALVATAPAARAAQPQFWKLEGARDFLDGDTEGLSVDSEGRVRLAPAVSTLHDPEAPYVWTVVRDKGVVYAGTGNDGKVFRVEKGKATVLFDAPELEVHALAAGPDGRLYAGTSPDGKVYAIGRDGKAETFFDPSDKYIWALAFDRSGHLLVATGTEARIHRVDPQGKAQVVFTTPESHVTALAVDRSGNAYAGTAPGGVLYRLDTALKVFVLHDSPYREIKAIDVGRDGSVYAAAIDGGASPGDTSRTSPPPPATIPAGEVTVSESFSVLGPTGLVPATPAPSASPRPSEARSGGSKGAVLRIAPSGEVDTIWSSSDETPHALAAADGGAFVGTGNKGKLYHVDDDRSWTMTSDFPAEQVTALFRGDEGALALATSNPGRIHELSARAGEKGTFTSKVKDTETVSSWGRITWEAVVPAGTAVQLQTRTGNTGTPDSTWSDWSPGYTRAEGEGVRSDRARFVQVRAVLTGASGASPVLDTISTAYLQRNLRPSVASITVHPPGEIFQKPLSVTGEVEILGMEAGVSLDSRPATAQARASAPAPTTYSRKMYQRGVQTFSWKGEDANADTLHYEVSYRSVGEPEFRLLRRGLTDAVMAWDTTTVPNGRYVVRVTATDAPSNPESLALAGSRESAPFDVDNTPPAVTATLAQRSPLVVRAVARDESSIIRRAEYSIDGGRWQEVHPTDGISDGREETYEVTVAGPLGPGPHAVVVRAYDLLGNVATARVDLP